MVRFCDPTAFYCCWPDFQHSCTNSLDCCGSNTDCKANHLLGISTVCCVTDGSYGCFTDDDCCGSDSCGNIDETGQGYCE